MLLSPKTLIMFVAGILIFLLLFPSIYAHMLLNYAQVHRLQGKLIVPVYQQALELVPENQNIRWHAGVVMAKNRNYKSAIATLSPLIDQQLEYPLIVQQILSILVVSGQMNQALSTYQKIDTQPTVSSGVAVRLLTAYMEEFGQPPQPEMTHHLLMQVFNLREETAFTQRFGTELADKNFWSTPDGQLVRNAISWRSHPLTNTNYTNEQEFFISNETILSRITPILEVPSDTIKLGPELIENGSFEQIDPIEDKPEHWEPFEQYPLRNPGAFICGTDRTQVLSGNLSLRFDSLWQENAPELAPALAGFSYSSVTIPAETAYVVSLNYRTELQKKQPNMSQPPTPVLRLSQDFWLPETQGNWRQVTIVRWNKSEKDISISPFLRFQGIGSVWFDNISVRTISFTHPPKNQKSLKRIDNIH